MGSTYESTVVPASADEVWETLRDFHDLSWAPNVVESCEPVGEKSGDEPGAGRILNDAFRETLLEHHDEERTFRYSIDDGPSPVAKDDVEGYRGTVRVRAVTDEGHAFVEWSSEWTGRDDEVEEFCGTIYRSLLDELDTHFRTAEGR